MTAVTGEVASRIHDHLQKARSEAAAVEDPSVRQALEALAAATAELLDAARQD